MPSLPSIIFEVVPVAIIKVSLFLEPFAFSILEKVSTSLNTATLAEV